ncbi:MAG: hypothetical protein KME59_11450 [Trichormus sp. ATA11-4-KO1]|jgi:hypothetical protein|nr:hypothetical protein [Trichormus sp. ATA11-4-KO1]
MGTNLRITSAVIFCISAYLIIPKMPDATGSISALTVDELNSSGSNKLTTPRVNSYGLEDIYIPPNYGGPDSQHGSGTR